MSDQAKVSDLDLMAHFDGELSAAEDEAVIEAIADDAPSRAKLEALGQISEVVQTAVELEVDAVERSSQRFNDMWSQIEQRISANGIGVEGAPSAIPPTEAESPIAGESPGIFGAIAAWFERHRSQIASASLAAATAAVLVWFIRPPEKAIEYVEIDAQSGAGAGTAAEVIPVKALESSAPEIENLEVYDGSGVVLTVQGDEDEADSVVIWLSSAEDSVEGPI